jgi:hypothetical protein
MKAMVEVNEGIFRPEFTAEFVASHKIAGTFEQRSQHEQWLARKTELYSLLTQFARMSIQFKRIEAKDGLFGGEHCELGKRFDVLPNPVKDIYELEFMALHRAINESIAIRSFSLDAKSISSEEDVGGGKRDAFIAVDKAMVVSEGLH